VAIWELSGSKLIGFNIPAGKMGAEWQVAATGDFNGDGDSDILWHAESGSGIGQVTVWTMDGLNLVNSSLSNGQIGVEWNPVATGDFFGTGRAAVLWESNTGALQDWSLNGANLGAAKWARNGVLPGSAISTGSAVAATRPVTSSGSTRTATMSRSGK
jgi:hypothetical protein